MLCHRDGVRLRKGQWANVSTVVLSDIASIIIRLDILCRLTTACYYYLVVLCTVSVSVIVVPKLKLD